MIIKQDYLTAEQFAKLAVFLASESNRIDLSEHRHSRDFDAAQVLPFAQLIRSGPAQGSSLGVVLEVRLTYMIGTDSDRSPNRFRTVPDRYFLDLLHILQGDELWNVCTPEPLRSLTR